MSEAREVIPFRERRFDMVLWAFFFINLTVVTYQADLEQIVIKDPNNFSYPIWPLPFVIDAMHDYTRTYDPLVYNRPVWFQTTVWIDQLFYGPFYAVAMYAFWKGREWIRNWCFIWASVMLSVVTLILHEEWRGQYATDHLPLVIATNVGWIVFPILTLVRMWGPHPFTRPAVEPVEPVEPVEGEAR
jgi:hypothetical protein